MNETDLKNYEMIHSGETAYFEQKRGLIAVWGKEAVQFLNGLITNDVAKLKDGAEMLAALPNAQGRLIAVVRVKRDGDRFLFETEEATREKVFQNLFRFTFAGDFFVEDLSEKYVFRLIANRKSQIANEITFDSNFGTDVFAGEFANEGLAVSPELFEVLRIEKGIPLSGVDMNDTTIVPELGIEGLISYNKGCYIGQEIIARIYFRGHVAKQLRGLVFESGEIEGEELESEDGKPAGKITSLCFSPRMQKTIGLGFVRYDYLSAGTKLMVGQTNAVVADLPFVSDSN